MHTGEVWYCLSLSASLCVCIQYFSVYVNPSACLSASLSVQRFLSVHVSCLPVCMHGYQSAYLCLWTCVPSCCSASPFVCLSVCLSLYLFVCQFVCLSVCLHAGRPIVLPLCISLYQFPCNSVGCSLQFFFLSHFLSSSFLLNLRLKLFLLLVTFLFPVLLPTPCLRFFHFLNPHSPLFRGFSFLPTLSFYYPPLAVLRSYFSLLFTLPHMLTLSINASFQFPISFNLSSPPAFLLL